jgi:hypothetical protein
VNRIAIQKRRQAGIARRGEAAPRCCDHRSFQWAKQPYVLPALRWTWPTLLCIDYNFYVLPCDSLS